MYGTRLSVNKRKALLLAWLQLTVEKKIPLKLNDIYLVACVTENWYAVSPGCLVLTPFT